MRWTIAWYVQAADLVEAESHAQSGDRVIPLGDGAFRITRSVELPSVVAS